MVITIVYEDKVIKSKAIDLPEDEVERTAEGIYQSIEITEKFKLETPDGWVIIPKEVTQRSIIYVDK